MPKGGPLGHRLQLQGDGFYPGQDAAGAAKKPNQIVAGHVFEHRRPYPKRLAGRGFSPYLQQVIPHTTAP
jgi:hypothetical protein